MENDLNKPTPPAAAPVVPAPAGTIDATSKPEPMKAPPVATPPAPAPVAAAPKPTKTVVWDGSWSGIKPSQKDLQFGAIVAKQSKNALGNFYLDAKNGKAAFFPNPETYPKGGYFAGEAVPLP
jgi:hypothetical protein